MAPPECSRDQNVAFDLMDALPNTVDQWSNNRLVLALRLMALLPTNPGNGILLEELTKELKLSRSRLFRLMRALREADLDIESVFSAQGQKVYYIPRQRQTLINRILRS